MLHFIERFFGIYLPPGIAFSRFTSLRSTGNGLPPSVLARGATPGPEVLSLLTSAGSTGTGLPPVVETPGASRPGRGRRERQRFKIYFTPAK